MNEHIRIGILRKTFLVHLPFYSVDDPLLVEDTDLVRDLESVYAKCFVLFEIGILVIVACHLHRRRTGRDE